MFDQLTERFQSIVKNLTGQGRLSEKNIEDALRAVRLALLEADVHFQVVKDFTERVKTQALGAAVWDSLSPGQQFIRIVHDEMTALLGGGRKDLHLASQPPTVILMAGLQGTGKTTTAAKLALHFRDHRHKKPLLMSLDLQRPAAQEQLRLLCGQINVPFLEAEGRSVLELAAAGRDEADRRAAEILIVDSAGRLHVDTALMEELKQARKLLRPHYVLLVVDSMTGQDSVNQARAFQEQIGVDGAILTKLDGDSRGGAALSIVSVAKVGILFTGTGEKLDGLEPFAPDRMAGRILGMGDVLTLAEKAQGVMDEKQAREMERKLRKNKFDLEDFLDQMKAMKKMGPMSELMGMIPGLGSKLPPGAQVDGDKAERQLKQFEAMILSMTPEERQDPALLNGRRRERIAKGSGTSVGELNRFLKQFQATKAMMKQMGPGKGKMPF